VRKIVELIGHRLQVILCDNEYGGYGHPDHIKLHQATVQAFQQQPTRSSTWQPGRPTRRALYFTASRGLAHGSCGLCLAGAQPAPFWANETLTWRILKWRRRSTRPRASYLDTKSSAPACHRSQAGPSESFRGLPGFVLRRMFGYETFSQGYPAPAPGAGIAHDLFASR
jgi:LmbE family N-acetylglucosaminyl deacetylase